MRSTRVLTTGLILLAAACSSSPTTTSSMPDALITSDIATMTADATTEDVDVMASMDGSIGNLMGAPLGSSASLVDPSQGRRPGMTGCSFAGGHFTCPPLLRNGLTVTRTVTFMADGGATQDSYDSLLTASIHVVAAVSGDVTRGPWSATVARNRDLTISGLLGTETTRTVNGTGSESVSRARVTVAGNTRSYDIIGASTVTNVVVPVRAEGVDPWPLSGTITRTYTVTRTDANGSGGTVTRTVVITFNGSSTPTAMVNGEPFTLNLSSRTASHR